MTLKYYASVLRKRWLTILIITGIAVGAAFGITRLMSPTYAANATSFVRLSNQTELLQNSQFALNRVASYTKIVHSPAVLAPVIRQLNLDMDVSDLDSHVAATNPTDTVLLVVSATSGSAGQAKAIANAVSHNLAREIETVEATRAGVPSPVAVTVIVPATTPGSPVSPRPSLNIILGFLLGLAIGIVAAVVRDQMDTRVKSTEDIKHLSDASPLGTVRLDPEFRTQPLVALHRRDGGVEDFRSIRTTLQFVNVDTPPRQIVISSAVAQEGKTVTALNLAVTMAQADIKVCLVEGDLRRPKVTSYLGMDGSLGLTDVVAGHYSLTEVLVPWHRGELTVLPAGTTPPDPGQLLGSRAMDELMKELRDRFDLVLIDAPPLLPVSDAAVLGGVSDGVILVARHRHVRREQFAAAVESLHAVGANLLGSVLTHVPAKERAAHYGADYEYARPSRPEWSVEPLREQSTRKRVHASANSPRR